MDDNMTGPELFKEASGHLDDIMEGEASYTSANGVYVDNRLLYATIAAARATQAQTAVLLMLTETQGDYPPYEVDAWRKVLPRPPLKEPEQSPPQPVDQKDTTPTGPRIYVQDQHGTQGHVLRGPFRVRDGELIVQVQWHTPGAQPVWVNMSVLQLITSDEVDRCPNGLTGDECGSGENQCELCLAAEDEEADEIEESMG